MDRRTMEIPQEQTVGSVDNISLGRMGESALVNPSPAVGVLVTRGLEGTEEAKVLLVPRQQLAANESEMVEIPAGKIDPEDYDGGITEGEAALRAAKRELAKKAGLMATSLDLLIPRPIYYTAERIWLTNAIGPYKEVPREEDDHILSEWVTFLEVQQRISLGEIQDGKTVIAIEHALINLVPAFAPILSRLSTLREAHNFFELQKKLGLAGLGDSETAAGIRQIIQQISES